MNVSTWSIRNPAPAILLFVLLTVLGLLGFRALQVQDFPDLELPLVQVSASLEGAAPGQLENEVARKIEDALASLPNLEHINTTISDGTARIDITFGIDKGLEEALGEVRNAVDSVRADLPAGMAPPVVSKATAVAGTLITYTVTSSELDEQDLSWFIDHDLTRALLEVRGVGRVTRLGGVDREIQVDLHPAQAAGLGLTAADVSARLGAMQLETSGGEGEIGGQRMAARTLPGVATPQDIAALNVPLPDGRVVRLDHIADVRDGHATPRTAAFRDGVPVMAVQVARSRGHSDVTVAEDVRLSLRAFAERHPHLQLAEASNAVTPVIDNYRDAMSMLVEGALLAVVVVAWFLRDWRSTLIAATALPLSILPTFVFMAWAGYSLNTVTLLSLSLVVGILVDDAIVEIENIERHLRMGKTPRQAAMEAAQEIGLAVLATTLALVAVFLPTAFMSGVIGKVFRQFGLTASVAVLASLLVARLLTPMMAAYLMKPRPGHPDEPAQDGRMMRGYLAAVRTALAHRRWTAVAVAAVMLASFAIVPLLSTGFLPPEDIAQTRVVITLPPGSRLQDTIQAAREAEARLRELPQVRHVLTEVGMSSQEDGPTTTMSTSQNVASLTVDLVPRSERSESQPELETQFRKHLHGVPGARVEVGAGGNGEVLEVSLTADDPQALSQAAAQVERALRTVPGTGHVLSSAALERPEIQVQPDLARAASLGVTAQAMSDAIRFATQGDYGASLPKLNLPQRQVPIRVRMAPSVHDRLELMSQLRLPAANGAVSLGSVADLQVGSGPAQIDRMDRARLVSFTVALNGHALGDIEEAVSQLPELQNLPPGVKRVERGELQRMDELFDSFAIAMLIGVFCIYAVLVVLFHDFLQPATILSALPLSLGGALFALWVTHQPVSMPAMIGLLMLMGIVTKNSILLVEYTIMSRRSHGTSRWEAVMDACHKRARPVVMTTLAMAAGMLPNALGFGADPSFRQPMAIVVIGGLMASTALSLIVVPVVFTLVDDLLLWGRSRFMRPHEDAAPHHVVGLAPGGDPH